MRSEAFSYHLQISSLSSIGIKYIDLGHAKLNPLKKILHEIEGKPTWLVVQIRKTQMGEIP